MALNDRETRLAYLNDKVEQLAEEQEAELVSDYDEAEAEYRKVKPPIHIRFRGHDFVLPATMPFSFSMFFMRNCVKRKGDKLFMEVPDDKVAELIERMFGSAFLKLLEETDVELGFVVDHMIPDIMGKWGQQVASKAERGNV